MRTQFRTLARPSQPPRKPQPEPVEETPRIEDPQLERVRAYKLAAGVERMLQQQQTAETACFHAKYAALRAQGCNHVQADAGAEGAVFRYRAGRLGLLDNRKVAPLPRAQEVAIYRAVKRPVIK
jgi:hypothetical protein